jgi:hypothetical protein
LVVNVDCHREPLQNLVLVGRGVDRQHPHDSPSIRSILLSIPRFPKQHKAITFFQ